LAKATACAHAIQGLVKYHGLKNKKLRLPYHNSVSVCVEKLTTTATIEFGPQYAQDSSEINGTVAQGTEALRVMEVVNALRKLAKRQEHFHLVSANSLVKAKGLGFSASAFAAIALAASDALGLRMDREHLSEIARLGAGSASRSIAGGFAIWYANKNGRSYARQLADGKRLPLAMGIVPQAADVKTDKAHEESVSSPFFTGRLREVNGSLRNMVRAISRGDLDEVCRLAEVDSRSLHAITMTGKSGLVLMTPETINVIRRVRAMREELGIPVWYSLDTGPSVFLNTHDENLDEVCDDVEKNTDLQVIKSGVGGSAYAIDQHLF
jgi:phosphomevalonate decarboxylase